MTSYQRHAKWEYIDITINTAKRAIKKKDLPKLITILKKATEEATQLAQDCQNENKNLRP